MGTSPTFPQYHKPGILSLLDMLKADVASLAWALGALGRHAAISGAAPNTSINGEHRATLLESYTLVRKEFARYDLHTTLDRLKLAISWAAIDTYNGKEVQRDCEEVIRTAESELGRIYFGHVAASKAQELTDAERLWSASIIAFPSSKKDAVMASRCYALECNDACVYHSMMVLERGMLALAGKLKVKKAGVRAWEGIIDDIEKEIEKRQTKLRAKKPNDFLTFLSEAAKEFRYFKDAWRNHTAHGRAQYDENDARKVLIHVRDFMEHISTRLKDQKK